MSDTKYVSQIDYVGPHQIVITGGQSRSVALVVESDKLNTILNDCISKTSSSTTQKLLGNNNR